MGRPSDVDIARVVLGHHKRAEPNRGAGVCAHHSKARGLPHAPVNPLMAVRIASPKNLGSLADGNPPIMS